MLSLMTALILPQNSVANKDELLEMIMHSAEKIINSSDDKWVSIPHLLVMSLRSLLPACSSMVTLKLSSSAVKSIPWSSIANTKAPILKTSITSRPIVCCNNGRVRASGVDERHSTWICCYYQSERGSWIIQLILISRIRYALGHWRLRRGPSCHKHWSNHRCGFTWVVVVSYSVLMVLWLVP